MHCAKDRGFKWPSIALQVLGWWLGNVWFSHHHATCWLKSSYVKVWMRKYMIYTGYLYLLEYWHVGGYIGLIMEVVYFVVRNCVSCDGVVLVKCRSLLWAGYVIWWWKMHLTCVHWGGYPDRKKEFCFKSVSRGRWHCPFFPAMHVMLCKTVVVL